MSEPARMKYELSTGVLNPPPASGAITSLSASVGFALPADYLAFLAQHDGGEGFIRDKYTVLWRVEELLQFNREYEVVRYAPGIFLFGSDGGGEGIGFDTLTNGLPVVVVPFIGMARADAIPIARDVTELLASGWQFPAALARM